MQLETTQHRNKTIHKYTKTTTTTSFNSHFFKVKMDQPVPPWVFLFHLFWNKTSEG